MTKDKKSWPFPIYSGLLQDGHKKKIGDALWEFLWCIDRTTTEENGIGWVLGKKPITLDEIAKTLGDSRRTTQRHLEVLKEQGYITIKRASKGLIIGVLKSKKWSGKSKISSEERQILKYLKGISHYPFDYESDLEFLRTLWVDFPGVKIPEELKKWSVWLMDNRKKLKGKVNYRLRFRNWLQIGQGGKYGRAYGGNNRKYGKEGQKFKGVFEEI